MRPRRQAASAALLLLLALPACQPVNVRGGETAVADIRVPPRPQDELNILAIGRADAEGRILLRATGVDVVRGETATIGMMGPGLVEGTSFVVLGKGFRASVVRYGETQGGSGPPMPAAVVSLVVPEAAATGLYSIIAVRDVEMAMLSGGVEVQ